MFNPFRSATKTENKGAEGNKEAPPQENSHNASDEASTRKVTLSPEVFSSGLFGDEYKGLEGNELVSKLSDDYINSLLDKRTSIRVPTKDSTEDEVKAFKQSVGNHPNLVLMGDDEQSQKEVMRKLGVPEKKEDYLLPKELEINEHSAEEALQFSEKLGLTQNQFSSLINAISKNDREQAEIRDMEQTQIQQNKNKALDNRWGIDKENRLKGAEASLNLLSKELGGEWLEHAKKTGALDNPIIITALANMGEGLLEKGIIVDSKVNYGDTSLSVSQKLSELRNDPDYYKNTPRTEMLREKAYQLTKALRS